MFFPPYYTSKATYIINYHSNIRVHVKILQDLGNSLSQRLTGLDSWLFSMGNAYATVRLKTHREEVNNMEQGKTAHCF